MRYFLGLCRHQGRCLAVLGALGLGLAGVGALLLQVAAGFGLVTVFAPGNLVDTFCAFLPELLLVVVPLGVVHGVASLHHGGEVAAVRGAGVGPWRLAAAVLLPCLPLVAVLHLAMHEARPAALLRLQERWMNVPDALFVGLEARGVGMVRDGNAARALLPAGDTVYALEIGDLSVAGGMAIDARAGRVRAVRDAITHDVRFARAQVVLPKASVGLANVEVAALSSRFLRTQAVRWQRAKLRWSGEPPARRVLLELWRREASPLGLLLLVGLLAVALARVRSCSVLVAYGMLAPLAVGISLALPRLIGAFGGA